jgi:hypothetical protein
MARLTPATGPRRALLQRALRHEPCDPAEEQCVDTLLNLPQEEDDVYFDVINQYLEEIEALRDLHANGTLRTESSPSAACNWHASLGELHFPPGIG